MSKDLGRPIEVLETEPVLRDDLAPYFYAYLELRGRASSFSGAPTWTDLHTYHQLRAPHLEFDLLVDMTRLLEAEDRAIYDEQHPRRS